MAPSRKFRSLGTHYDVPAQLATRNPQPSLRYNARLNA